MTDAATRAEIDRIRVVGLSANDLQHLADALRAIQAEASVDGRLSGVKRHALREVIATLDLALMPSVAYPKVAAEEARLSVRVSAVLAHGLTR